MAAIPATVMQQTYQMRAQAATLLADATNPAYLQAQDQLSASQQLAQRLQTSYNISHPISQTQLLQDAQYQEYATQQTQAYQQALKNSPSYLSGVLGNIGA